jgi:hypothetical protein
MNRPANLLTGRLLGFSPCCLSVVALIAVHLALGLGAVSRKSMTFDEGIHVTGGLSYWRTNDYRLQPENGNWSQRFVALPAWLAGFTAPEFIGTAWQSADVRGLEGELFYSSGNDADTLLARSRLAMALPSAILALVVFVWSRRLFGTAGGLISLTLYAFSPTILANGFLTTSDLFAALFLLVAAGAQWSMLWRITPFTFATAAVCTAGALLCKSSGVLLLPIGVALLVMRMFYADPAVIACGRPRLLSGRATQVLLFATVGAVEFLAVVLLIWASFGFRYAAFATQVETAQFEIPWSDVEGGLSPVSHGIVQFVRHRKLLPEAYVYGLSQLLTTKDRSSYFHGQLSWTGWTLFFPASLLLKTPLELFLLLGIIAASALRWRAKSRIPTSTGPTEAPPTMRGVIPLLALWTVYWAFAIASGLNIGHRHLLPTYPPMFILCGAAGAWFSTSSTLALRRPLNLVVIRVLVTVLLTAYAAEGLWFWPDYLAYFNVLAGGPRHAYRWFVDSSLDWGQDLKELRPWLDISPDEAGAHAPVYLSYFGVARPDYYQIHAAQLPGKGIPLPPRLPPPLEPGLYCVSATMLEQVYSRPRGRWNAAYEQLYQQGREFVDVLRGRGVDHNTTSLTPDEQRACALFEELRWARLCSFLRAREPDDLVGYSILLYRITESELANALDGPPVELLQRPETEVAPAPP